MAANFKHFGRLLRAYAKMDLIWFMRDTKICLLYMAADAVSSLTTVAGSFLLASRFDGFGGMSRAEILFMLGYAMLVSGVYALLFMNNNAGAISRIIGRGQIDHILIQPVPMILHLMTNGFAPVSGTATLLCGIGVTIYATVQMAVSVHFLWVLALIGMVLASMLIMAAWVYAISSLAFWAPYAAEEIAPEVQGLFTSMASYPLGGLAQAAQFIFSTVVPIGAMAWLPSSILLGKGNVSAGICVLAAVTAVSITIATMIFRKGLKYYAKYSSPRYSGFGRS